MDNYLFGKYITQDGLKNIKEHKYKAGGYSILDNLMNPWWEFVVKCVPKSVAPNMLTLIGVLINFGFYMCMFFHDPSMSQPLPEWTYAGFAIGLFAYQTLDAIDGKQARRTGSSSPLGQLFDHGCDALSTTFVGLAMIHTLQLGLTLRAKIIIGTLWTPFFLAQLLEHHVGLVRTHVGNIGVTEGQIAQSLIMLACSILGPNIYLTTVKDALEFTGYAHLVPEGYELRDLVIIVLCINAFMFCAYLLFEMLVSITGFVNKLRCLYHTLPVALFIVFLYLVDPSDKFTSDHASLLIMGQGLVFTLVTTKLIISNMAKMPYIGFQIESFVYGFYFYAQYCLQGPEHDMNQKYAFIASTILISLVYFKFVRVCILQITEHLGIYCFTIKPKTD